jgi:SulP family sulfate permease
MSGVSVSSLSFRPKLAECLRDYSRARFLRDVFAGLTVGLVALPLAIGFGIASGVSPGAGIYTAIIGGFLVSVLGGSRVQIGGPAGAFVGLVYTIVAQHGLPNLLVCTALAGLLLLVIGAARLGTLIKFIPHPVTTGFTCGIAVTIIATQVKEFFGLPIARVPVDFVDKLVAFARALPSLSWPTLAVGVASALMVAAWPARWSRRIPGSIVAVLVGTLGVWLLELPVETIRSRFGELAFPHGLPDFKRLDFDWSHLGELVRPALSIALLGAIESLLSAVVADGMIDDRHDANQELMGQGIANLVVPFFGGIPVTGAIARTATNVRNGASTPLAGVVHAATLLAIVLIAAPLAKFILLATLAAVLGVVAIRMGEWEEFVLLRRQARSDAAVFLVTFALTVLFDLTVAVEMGIILAAGLFIKRVTDTTHVAAVDGTGPPAGQGHEAVKDVPPGVLVYRVFGALLFGAADKVDNVLRRAAADANVVVLHMAAVSAMDGTALNALETLHEKLRLHRKHLILSGPHTQPYFLMQKAGFLERVGEANVVGDLAAAVARARELIEAKK